MKKIKKIILAALVLFYLGITVTITLPDLPENPSVQNCQADMDPFGPFDDDGGKH